MKEKKLYGIYGRSPSDPIDRTPVAFWDTKGSVRSADRFLGGGYASIRETIKEAQRQANQTGRPVMIKTVYESPMDPELWPGEFTLEQASGVVLRVVKPRKHTKHTSTR
jgi:hypothetical protein